MNTTAIRAKRGWVAAGLLSSVLFVLLVFATLAVVVLGASIATCTNPSEETAIGRSGEAPSTAAVAQIPPARLALYEQAGQRFDIDWSFLASIGTQECSTGDCAGTNPAGCAGPMQIAYRRNSECSPGSGPTLWERYAVSAHPGQPADVNDPADAIFTAARILREDKNAPPAGGSYQAYYQAACHYYGACADKAANYATEVMARAILYGFAGPGTPHTTSRHPNLAEPATAQPPTGCSAFISPGGQAGSQAIVKIAESQLGHQEHPAGSNCTPYGPCEEWCSLFAAWVWQHAGIPIPGPTALYGYSGSLYTWVAQHAGRTLPPSTTPAPGDLIFYGESPTASLHVGIVTRVLHDGRIETIDGNYKNQVSRVGPFDPAHAPGPGPVYGYAQPPTTAAGGVK